MVTKIGTIGTKYGTGLESLFAHHFGVYPEATVPMIPQTSIPTVWQPWGGGGVMVLRSGGRGVESSTLLWSKCRGRVRTMTEPAKAKKPERICLNGCAAHAKFPATNPKFCTQKCAIKWALLDTKDAHHCPLHGWWWVNERAMCPGCIMTKVHAVIHSRR